MPGILDDAANIAGEAKKQGRNEAWEAYGADALVEMAKHSGSCDGSSNGSGPKALVHVRVDHSALVRGHTEPGETCEIAGVGPISAAAARALASDAFLAAVVTDGVDIKSISHLGRSIPARLRTAITARSPLLPALAISRRMSATGSGRPSVDRAVRARKR